MVMLLSKHGWWILFSLCITFCVSFGHEFAKGSKVKLLKTDPVRSAPSAVSEFKRHVEGKRNKKYHDKNRILHKDISTLLRKKWKEIWKMLMRYWIDSLNLKSVKTEQY